MSKERDYGIDLLRLVLMFFVCLIHTLENGRVLEHCEKGTLEYYGYWFIFTAIYCAVDAFAIISGYTSF